MRTVPILRPAEHRGRWERYTVIGDGLKAAPTGGGICRLIRQHPRHRRPGWMLTMREPGQHDGMLLIEADCGRGVTTRIGPTKNRGPRRQFRLWRNFMLTCSGLLRRLCLPFGLALALTANPLAASAQQVIGL